MRQPSAGVSRADGVWLRRWAVGLSTAGLLWGGAATAWAHVDAKPSQAVAGSTSDVGFVVEHGCSESPTTALAVKLASGVTNPQPQPVAGFKASVDTAAGTVTWAGGSVPHDNEQAFTIRMTLPNTPGQTLFFPIVQTCQQSEVRWVELPAPGQDPDDLAKPAASLKLIAAPAPAAAPQSTPTAAAAPAGNAGTQQQPQVAGAAVQQEPLAAAAPVGGIAAGGGGTAGPDLARFGALLAALVAAAAAGGGALLAGRRR